MSITFRPLNKAFELLEATGLEITYAYDDLVFANHSALILRFDDEEVKRFHLHFNVSLIQEERDRLFFLLSQKAAEMDVFIVNDVTFDIISNEEKEELDIVFQQCA